MELRFQKSKHLNRDRQFGTARKGGRRKFMLRTLGQSMLAVLLIFARSVVSMQEMLFWVAVVACYAVLNHCRALIFWLRQTARQDTGGFRRNREDISAGHAPRLPSRDIWATLRKSENLV